MDYQTINSATGDGVKKFSDLSNDWSALRSLVHHPLALVRAAKFCFTLNVERLS
jgi:hypothetical protein